MKSKAVFAPYLVWMVIFILVPMLLVVYFAFTDKSGAFTLENIMKVGQYSNEDLISISFRGEDKGAVDSTIFFNIIGSYAGWSGGLMYRLSKDGLYLYAGGANGDDA